MKKPTPLQIKQSRIMLRARIKFTHKCLMKLAFNNSLICDKMSSAADIHSIFTPICPNYSLN